jgi:hypothetical protein
MNIEQLTALRKIAEKAAEKTLHSEGCQCVRDFERAFRPAMCKELVEEVERLTRENTELTGRIANALI